MALCQSTFCCCPFDKENKMIDKNQCIMCGACVSACPHGAITFGEDGYPQINPQLCTKCGTCQAICPVCAIDIEN
ncbi:MAG: 4Fe-4S binding protein [Clostridia bacterium]